MDWKEFLKPDWKKIIIFIVLFAIFVTVTFFWQTDSIWATVDSNTGVITLSDYAKSYIATWFWVRPDLFLNPAGGVVTPFGVVLDVIYWYLISSIVIWIYDKVKERMKYQNHIDF